MRVLSIQQPWAWLIVNGYKDVENRDWPTKVRGEIAVHAGKKIDTLSLAHLRRERPDIPFPETFETGGVVGTARVTDCVDFYDSPWFSGTYGFVLADPQTCVLIPLRGQLGFFAADLPTLAAHATADAATTSPPASETRAEDRR